MHEFQELELWVSSGRVTFSLLHRAMEKHGLPFSRTRMINAPRIVSFCKNFINNNHCKNVYHLNILFVVLECVSGAPMPQGSPWVTQTLVANLSGSCYYQRIDLAKPNKI